jgi:hypothetical protein
VYFECFQPAWQVVTTILLICSYERSSIEEWFALGKTTSPKTGAELSSKI